MKINKLVDLNSLRTAPRLSNIEVENLLEELENNIFNADWITIGIMALSDHRAIEALQSISKKYSSIKFGNLDSLHADGSVFLKGNQKTGNVFVRSENGLGEGILITCQYDEDLEECNTFGPLPLDFFNNYLILKVMLCTIRIIPKSSICRSSTGFSICNRPRFWSNGPQKSMRIHCASTLFSIVRLHNQTTFFGPEIIKSLDYILKKHQILIR